jgi:hypothetical protein
MESTVKCFDCRQPALVTLYNEFFKCTHCGIYGFRFTAAGKDRLKIQDREPQRMGNVGDLMALAMSKA